MYLHTEVAASEMLLIFYPVTSMNVFQVDSKCLKNGIKYESSCIEEFENETNCDTADQVWKNIAPFEKDAPFVLNTINVAKKEPVQAEPLHLPYSKG